ncbi:MAG: hypothetical protein K0R49_1356 [Burkholderiales bacterium]|jgi:hypothetical protein|nr:hypothetical protein [Burkholderiales bacterium]
MQPKRNKVILTLKIIAIAGLLIGIFFHSFKNKGSQQIANRSDNSIYVWKSGALRTKGPITPEGCSLTTSKCKCELSAQNSQCSFDFTFDDIVPNANVAIASVDLPPSVSSTVSEGCTSGNPNQINGCTITYKWDKTAPFSKKSQIVLTESSGVQTLLDLQLEAK